MCDDKKLPTQAMMMEFGFTTIKVSELNALRARVSKLEEEAKRLRGVIKLPRE